MCGISGSYDLTQLDELTQMNLERGNRAHSLVQIDPSTHTWTVRFEDKPYDGSILEQAREGMYNIIHVQAPTATSSGHHPAAEWDYGLIHNGLIKEDFMKTRDHHTKWDTEWMLREMLYHSNENEHFVPVLSKIRGSFSCILLRQNAFVWMFRNSIAPMFIGSDLNISTTEFAGSMAMDYNTVYRLDIKEGYIFPIDRFENEETPYYGV